MNGEEIEAVADEFMRSAGREHGKTVFEALYGKFVVTGVDYDKRTFSVERVVDDE